MKTYVEWLKINELVDTNEYFPSDDRDSKKDEWVVETFQIYGGWENVWTEEDENGNSYPQIFSSKAQAEDALDEFFRDMDEADMDYNPKHYRVVPKKR